MEKFEINTLNRKLMLLVAIPLFILFLIGIFYYSDYLIDNNIEKLILIAFIPFLFAIALLNRICKKKYTIEITDTDFSIKDRELVKKSVQLNQIMLVKHQGGVNFGTDLLLIYADRQEKPLLNVSVTKQSDIIKNILNRITNSGKYTKSQRLEKNILWNEYFNDNLLSNNADTLARINTHPKRIARKAIFIGVTIFVLFFVGCLIPFFVNPKAFYEFEHDKVLYGDKVIEGVNPKEARTLSYTILKDSSHIYYKGEILDWADRATFTCLRDPFYYDKNGVYYETSNLFSKNKIVPIEGEYDAATFESVGGYSSHYFRDKNNLYTLTVNMMDGDKSPLEKVEVAGLDIASFKMLEHSFWFVDKNRVYFSTRKELRPCDEIDRNTFETLSWNVAKDKNHVYYLTRFLSSENKKATEKDNYTILEGADAATFRRINDKNYEDKNQTWTIRNEGEKVNRRNDVE